VVASYRNDYLEADSLKLGKEQFPLPVSLQSLVLDGFADPARSAQGGQAMPREELINYIRSGKDEDINPLESVLAQPYQHQTTVPR
jgi:hypothetical protein